MRSYSSQALNTATAFWPPNPNPLTTAVRTRCSRATFGTSVICSFGNSTGSNQNMTLLEVRVTDGATKEILRSRFFNISKLALLPGGNGLIFSARTSPEDNNQLWRLSYPGMEVTQISDGVISYGYLSITAKADKAAGTQVTRIADVWIGAAREPGSLKRITQATDACWTPDGQILYSSNASGNRDLWMMRPDGTQQRQLTVDPAMDATPAISADNRYIVFTSYRSGTFQVWRMNVDGTSQIQLTNGNGKQWPSISPDNKWVFYNSTDDWTLWKVSIEGGEPVQLTQYPAVYSVISPDGKMIAVAGRNEPRQPFGIWILPVEGGQPLRKLEVPKAFQGGRMLWTPDSKYLIYGDQSGGRTAIFKQALSGSRREEIASVEEDEVFDFSYSADGQFLAITRGAWKHDVVLISDLNP